MSFPADGAYPASYYAATATPAPERPRLEGEAEADVCVVGAGYTGLSCALELAERGHKVTLVEAARVGWGASGRNGGQMVNGINAPLDRIGRLYGPRVQAFVGGLVTEGGQIIRERVARYGIACDLKPGNLFAACTDRQMRALEDKRHLWSKYGMDDHELLDREAIRAHVGTDAYVGGMIDRSGGHLHPLNLALGEAAAIERLGGVIHERSPVRAVDTAAARPVVTTDHGRITARTLVLCGNAYLGRTVPALATRVLAASTQIVATEPLGARAKQILPTDLCVEDLRYILDYFRLAADGALLFGGGTVYGGSTPRDIERKLRPNLEKVFPQLKGVRLTHAWSGNFALTFSRVPQLGRLGPASYFAHGYSGHGVTGSHLFGRILAEAITGDLSRFDTFANLPWSPFPGGQALRVPYSVAGSWWYGLRDRLGI
ncbi:FAD-dependent oxidoreductase [Rhodobacteraceae bacterium 2CG4]|uniref:FAD-dependent oxidoreductase n=1 Tax=Halovulum marinum TaxID=2662447 RepID=A0A6L5Z6B9_9RHOB|nr:FAD-binding oxidoreductase [Halovulum marinum]MSU91584.1 FAD-dependent oxidoreductase [Halovulum marinum]